MQPPLIALLALVALPGCLTVEVHLPQDVGQTRATATPAVEAPKVRSTAEPAELEPVAGLQTITIDEALLSLGEGSPANVFDNQAYYSGTVLLRMGLHEDFERVKDFMSDADQTFELQFDGGAPIPGEVGIGGITVNGVSYAIWRPSGRDVVPASALKINVFARNEEGERRWTVAPYLAMH